MDPLDMPALFSGLRKHLALQATDAASDGADDEQNKVRSTTGRDDSLEAALARALI